MYRSQNTALTYASYKRYKQAFVAVDFFLTLGQYKCVSE